MRCRSGRLGGVALAGLVVLSGVCAGAGFDANSVRREAGPKVCLVRVDGGLGLPVSYASGFLFGESGFVLTDLASVAQPGVTAVTVTFEDGTTAVAETFSMADPALGVAAIGIDVPKAKAKGLRLSTEKTPPEDLPAAVVGWKWGEQLEVTAGRLKGSLKAAELAGKLEFAEPAPEVEFGVFLCPRLDIATGAAVVGADGRVVGVMVRVLGVDQPIVAPAHRVREALLAAGANVKPLAAVPNALWPVSLQMTPGRPPTAANFAAAARLVKRRSLCRKCLGSGQVKVKVFDHYEGVGPLRRPVYRTENRPCQACRAEGLVCDERLYGQFAQMAEGATWLLSAPDTAPNVRDAVFENSMGLLDVLGQVPPHYRSELVSQAQSDINGPKGQYPRGAVLYAQVGETVSIHGDMYTVLLPHGSHAPVMVNADTLTPAYAAKDDAPTTPSGPGEWVVVGGVLQGTAEVQGVQPFFMRLFGWATGPRLGPKSERKPFADEPATPSGTVIVTGPEPSTPSPSTPSPARPPVRTRPKAPPTKRPPKKAGEPSFFGL